MKSKCLLSYDNGGFPNGTVVKNPPANARDARDLSLILGLGRPPREGNGNPFKYSCLGNFMDRGALAGYNTRGCKDSDVIEQLSTETQKLPN